MWVLQLSCLWNFLKHITHSNGCSPVCIRICLCMCCFVPDLCEQNGHLKSLTPMQIGSFCQLKRKQMLTQSFLKNTLQILFNCKFVKSCIHYTFSHMSNTIIFPIKFFATILTFEWLFTIMCANMPFHVHFNGRSWNTFHFLATKF